MRPFLPACQLLAQRALQKIDRIQSSLSSDLDALFASTLTAIAGDAKLSELEKNKILPDLTECIRTYDVLGLWRDAEEILRSEVMRPFIKKVCNRNYVMGGV